MLKLQLSGLMVLVVDDQRPFQVMLKGILNSLGIAHIHFANHGEQALQRCSQNEYDLLFVDYNLGPGKNGRQLLADLRQKQLLKASSIFIIVTGENTVTMVMSAVELEPDDYLIKPFSQSLLKSRLQKLAEKKQQLAALYQALLQQQPEQIIQLCRQEIASAGRYEQFCRRVLAETLFEQQCFDELELLLSDSMSQRRPSWALLLEAKFRLQQQDYPRCLEICQESIEINRLCAQAYDLQASCQLAQGDLEAAMTSINQALAIAPYHLPRQYLTLKVARAAGQIPEMVSASKQIFDLTRKTSQQDISHLFNYIRTMLDAIGNTTDASKRNRLQQETLLTLHRSQNDEQLIRDTNFDRFEQICVARLEALDGRFQPAKKTAATLSPQMALQDPDIPDLAMLLLSIGEFEDASQFIAQLSDTEQNDPILSDLLEHQQQKFAGAAEQLAELNRTGMQLYQEGKFQEAIVIFDQALNIAPSNTGAALNLIQSLLQVLESQQKNKSLAIYQRCRQTFKLIEHAHLPERHQLRYAELQNQYQQYRQELKQSS
ncbi:DNA-binding protein [Rheinheimera sp. SA_1]|uniref:tetratricopeptide repeat-containing response regulator n=1 Tax=Rheinheimera sp. SA_1 TaxID=1827365 RepID=UPI0008009D7F|nr:tetratricopeptide repeat-containing response regulator [Rheinheimera sp. SA_1]OBP15214.1 DNA-binding protein [Rheinheimera sp. SA_1]